MQVLLRLAAGFRSQLRHNQFVDGISTCPDSVTIERLRSTLESDGDRVPDLHLWRLGPGHLGAIVSVSTDRPRDVRFYLKLLKAYDSLSHVTEVVSRA